jgi:hypothetical protein
MGMLFSRPWYRYTIDLRAEDRFTLPRGDYFLLVRPFSPGTQGKSYWLTSRGSPESRSQLYFRSSYYGYPEWTPGSQVFGNEYDVNFRLYGTTAAPDTAWTRTFGGYSTDIAYSVGSTLDGGFIITGLTNSFGQGKGDVCLIKTDPSGNTVWARTFGGSRDDFGYSVQQTADGGYIVAGETWSFGPEGANVYLIKTNASGKESWVRTYGGTGNDHGDSVQETDDGGYIVAGDTDSFGAGEYDFYLVKTNSAGDTLWTRTFGTSLYESARAVRQTNDGGYIIAGYADRRDMHTDVYLVKTDSAGYLKWSKTYGGADDDYGYSVQQTMDGGYTVAGKTKSFGAGDYDAYLIRTDAEGNEIWSKTYGGVSADEGHSTVQTEPDSGFVVAGHTGSYGAEGHDIYLIKVDGNGSKAWSKNIGGPQQEKGQAVLQLPDGGYIVAGGTESYGEGAFDAYLIRTEPENLPPYPFSLLSPADAESITTSPVQFDWEDAIDPDEDDVSYDFYYSEDSLFSRPGIIYDLAESEYCLESELSNFTTYYWKVKACDPHDSFTWSREVFRFLTCYPEAVCELDPEYFSFELCIDETVVDSLFIYNPGNIDLTFSISRNDSWLDVIPAEGSIPPESQKTIEVICCAAELLPGTYQDTLTVTTNAKENPVQYIPVTLNVRAPVTTLLECDSPIAPRRGYLEFRAGLTNMTDTVQQVDAWLDLYLIGGKPYKENPLEGPVTFTLGPYLKRVLDRTHYVPSNTPLGGPYTLYLRCGQYPAVWDESWFEFDVVPASE